MLSKTERNYLSRAYLPRPDHKRVLDHRIRKKLDTFLMLELPLLNSSGVTKFSNIVTENSNIETASTKRNVVRSAGIEPATFSLGS